MRLKLMNSVSIIDYNDWPSADSFAHPLSPFRRRRLILGSFFRKLTKKEHPNNPVNPVYDFLF
jgi:hypothetical protein